MKILLCHKPKDAFGYITDSFCNALRDRGHDVRRWNGKEDSWHAFAPDLYCGASGHKQPIPANHTSKIAIHVNPYGPIDITNTNETKQDISWVIAQKPDVVFGYGNEEDRIIWSYWTSKHGIQWVPMPTAGDSTSFSKTTEHNCRKFDLIYLGGRWKYKSETIDKYLLPVLHENFNYSVRGYGHWPGGVCDGILPQNEANAFLNSGSIGPCVSEPHTHKYGIDIPERPFKLALCGTLIIHDPVPIKKFIPSAVVAKTARDFVELCRYYIENIDERIKLSEAQRAEVLAAHTYHHRMQTLLYALGFVKDAKEML